MFTHTDWWYYFEKIEQGKVAKCKHCDWTKDRSKDKSTNGLFSQAKYITTSDLRIPLIEGISPHFELFSLISRIPSFAHIRLFLRKC